MKQPKGTVANHQWVYRALQAAGTPMTAYQVLDAVRRHGISAPPTVYRALNRLVGEGLAHRLESINAYVACAEPKHRHRAAAFAICSDCGTIEEMVDLEMLKRLQASAIRRGFRINDTTIELRGQCAGCQQH
jgi:Fur family transcriptional regulator, zinc uptake regulator